MRKKIPTYLFLLQFYAASIDKQSKFESESYNSYILNKYSKYDTQPTAKKENTRIMIDQLPTGCENPRYLKEIDFGSNNNEEESQSSKEKLEIKKLKKELDIELMVLFNEAYNLQKIGCEPNFKFERVNLEYEDVLKFIKDNNINCEKWKNMKNFIFEMIEINNEVIIQLGEFVKKKAKRRE